jgi:group I intron endonuclease
MRSRALSKIYGGIFILNSMEKICGIYKITSPSGRVYIGQSVDIHRRSKEYKKGSKKQSRLNKSIIKYGWHLHTFEIIEECEIKYLNERERYWQDFYEVLGKNGLNCTLTKYKDKSGELSPNTKIKIRNANLGLKHPDWRNSIKSIAQGGENHWTKNKTFSEDTKIKMSKSHKELYKNGYVSPLKGRLVSDETKVKQRLSKIIPIIQFDLLGNIVKEYESITSVINFGYQPKYVIQCCKNKRIKYKNSLWKYKKESV